MVKLKALSFLQSMLFDLSENILLIQQINGEMCAHYGLYTHVYTNQPYGTF